MSFDQYDLGLNHAGCGDEYGKVGTAGGGGIHFCRARASAGPGAGTAQLLVRARDEVGAAAHGRGLRQYIVLAGFLPPFPPVVASQAELLNVLATTAAIA